MPNHTPARHRRWQATVIITLFLIAVAGAAGVGWWYARESPPHQGPILLISVDGISASTLPPYGDQRRDMPAIEALAADSIVFDRAYAHGVQMLPAYTSLLTGLIPPAHGVRDDAGFVLGADARTLAELLRARGFDTGAAVSSFLLRRETGIAQGFAFFDAELPDMPGEPASAVARDGGLTIDAAERWVRAQGDQRYFLLMHVPGGSADAAVMRMVQALKERDLYDQATILFVGGRGNAGLGTTLDDTSLRVPFLVKQPDREGAGRRVSFPVQHADVVPTLLDLVRAPLPGGLAGRSLRPVLDDADATLAPQPIYSESLTAYFRFGGQPLFALTTDTQRYVKGATESIVEIESADENAGAADAEDAATLSATLDRLAGASHIAPPAPIAARDESRLALLGYLSGMRSPMAIVGLTEEQQASLVEAHRDAARLVGENKLFAAVGALQTIARDQPALASIHYQIGVLLARSGRLDEAIAAFQSAAQLEPQSSDASLALASTLLRAGRSNEAQEQASLAAALVEKVSPRDLAAAYEIAARAALELKDNEAANRHAQSAQDAEEGLPLPQFVQGRLLYDEGRYDEAVAAFTAAEDALRDDESIADLHFYLGESLTHLDRYPEAEAQFREEIRMYPRSMQAYGSLALLYRAMNREAEIEPVLEELLAAVPTPEGYAAAARLWTILGDRDRAETIRTEARTRFRGDPTLVLVGRAGRR